MDSPDQVPYYGDDDDGHTFVRPTESLATFGRCSLPVPSCLTTRCWGNPKQPPQEQDTVRAGREWRHRPAFLIRKPARKPACSGRRHLPIKTDGEPETYLHVDTAPLGYLSIRSPYHADALLFPGNRRQPYITDGAPIPIIPEPKWRAYFKGNSAHNTIRVDGTGPGVQCFACGWITTSPNWWFLPKTQRKSPSGAAMTDTPTGVTHTRTYEFNKRTTPSS